MAPQRLGGRCDSLAILAVALRRLRQHRLERAGRQVGAAVEDVSVGGEEDRQRPAAAAGQFGDRGLIPRVDVGPHVAIDLDGNEQLVDERRDVGVLVGLAVHLVAPVAPDRADVEIDRPVELPRQGKDVVAPFLPVDRLLRGRPQVRAGGLGELIAERGRVGLGGGVDRSAAGRQDQSPPARGRSNARRIRPDMMRVRPAAASPSSPR